MDKKSCFRTTIGGQALIEGIMMRGPEKACTVVRRPDGSFEKKTEAIVPIKKKYPILGWPFIRGAVNFWDMMKIGVSALTYSSEVALGESGADEPETFLERKLGRERADKIMLSVAVLLGLVIPVVLFFLLPTLLAGVLDQWIGSGILRNLLEGAIRILIFLTFLTLVSKMKDIQRTFAYHGAEHKTIHCYESKQALTVENARKFPRAHPRCGTSFLFVVMIISILVFTFVSWSNPFIRMALRILLLPVVVAISYEINRAVGRHDNRLTMILRKPGLWLQKLTTVEPEDSMLEVAIEALNGVIPEVKGSDTW